MQNNICPVCKTENEPEYQYCKNCGKALYESQKAANTTSGGAASALNPEPQPAINSSDSVDGNSIDQVVTFVGKNHERIVPKFIKIEKTGSKTDWCWPPFVLGILLGPIGTAMWFLYRKMYSAAAIFGAIGIAADYCMQAIDHFFGSGTSTFNSLEKYINGFSVGMFDYDGFMQALTNKNTVIAFFANSASNAIGIACAVLSGIFGIYLYKRHAAKTISKIKSVVTDTGYLKIAIASKGGRSVGAVIVGALIISFVSNLPNMIIGIIKAMEVLFA